MFRSFKSFIMWHLHYWASPWFCASRWQPGSNQSTTSLQQLLKHTMSPFFVTLYSTQWTSARDVFENKEHYMGVSRGKLSYKTSNALTHTSITHLCKLSIWLPLPKSHTFPECSYTLPGLFSWALASGHLVNIYSSVMLQWSGTGHADSTHTHMQVGCRKWQCSQKLFRSNNNEATYMRFSFWSSA